MQTIKQFVTTKDGPVLLEDVHVQSIEVVSPCSFMCKKFLICATKGENSERNDSSLKDLRNTRK